MRNEERGRRCWSREYLAALWEDDNAEVRSDEETKR